jgi:methylmalonyl-CoA/ethylmalonyl-CoA epimerase
MTILGIDHVGIAVRGDVAAETFARLLGDLIDQPPDFEEFSSQAVRVCFLPEAPPNVELMSPTGDGAVSRFLDRRGEGMHHVCFAVDDVAAELQRLERAGFELIDRSPREGHGGQVAFLHPRSTHGVLIELLQRAGR